MIVVKDDMNVRIGKTEVGIFTEKFAYSRMNEKRCKIIALVIEKKSY